MSRNSNKEDNNLPRNNNLNSTEQEPAESSSAAAPSSEDEGPVGTLREERLVKKLRNIDVLSPNSQQQNLDTSNFSSDSELVFNPSVDNSRTSLQNSPHNFPDDFHNTGLLTKATPRPVRPATVNYSQTKPKVYSSNMTSSKPKESGQLPTRITLSVNGTRFIVNPCIFTKHPNTMLGRYCSS